MPNNSRPRPTQQDTARRVAAASRMDAFGAHYQNVANGWFGVWNDYVDGYRQLMSRAMQDGDFSVGRMTVDGVSLYMQAASAMNDLYRTACQECMPNPTLEPATDQLARVYFELDGRTDSIAQPLGAASVANVSMISGTDLLNLTSGMIPGARVKIETQDEDVVVRILALRDLGLNAGLYVGSIRQRTPDGSVRLADLSVNLSDR